MLGSTPWIQGEKPDIQIGITLRYQGNEVENHYQKARYGILNSFLATR